MDFLAKVGYSGVIISIASIGAFLLGYFYQGAHNAGAAMTMAFATLCMARLFHGFSCKAEKPVIFSRRLWNNAFAILAFAAGMVLINAVLWIPALHGLFQIENGMSGVLIGAIYGFSVGSMILVQKVTQTNLYPSLQRSEDCNMSKGRLAELLIRICAKRRRCSRSSA